MWYVAKSRLDNEFGKVGGFEFWWGESLFAKAFLGWPEHDPVPSQHLRYEATRYLNHSCSSPVVHQDNAIPVTAY